MAADHFREWVEQKTGPRQALLVDDSIDDCVIITKLSKDFNITYTIAHNGFDALKKLKERPYDLVILDMKLGAPPEGVQLFREIKTLCPTCPVMVLSAHISNEIVDQVTREGFVMLAKKPSVFDSDYLYQMFQLLNIPKRLKEGASYEGGI